MRNNFILGVFFSILIAISSCNSESTEKKVVEVQTVVEKTDIKKIIKEDQLVMKKDPVCGMPVYKFLEDTTLYKGDMYGFCGKGCKDDFVKNPESYIPVPDKK